VIPHPTAELIKYAANAFLATNLVHQQMRPERESVATSRDRARHRPRQAHRLGVPAPARVRRLLPEGHALGRELRRRAGERLEIVEAVIA
jgi:hypothetical protein